MLWLNASCCRGFNERNVSLDLPVPPALLLKTHNREQEQTCHGKDRKEDRNNIESMFPLPHISWDTIYSTQPPLCEHGEDVKKGQKRVHDDEERLVYGGDITDIDDESAFVGFVLGFPSSNPEAHQLEEVLNKRHFDISFVRMIAGIIRNLLLTVKRLANHTEVARMGNQT